MDTYNTKLRAQENFCSMINEFIVNQELLEIKVEEENLIKVITVSYNDIYFHLESGNYQSTSSKPLHIPDPGSITIISC